MLKTDSIKNIVLINWSISALASIFAIVLWLFNVFFGYKFSYPAFLDHILILEIIVLFCFSTILVLFYPKEPYVRESVFLIVFLLLYKWLLSYRGVLSEPSFVSIYFMVLTASALICLVSIAVIFYKIWPQLNFSNKKIN